MLGLNEFLFYFTKQTGEQVGNKFALHDFHEDYEEKKLEIRIPYKSHFIIKNLLSVFESYHAHNIKVEGYYDVFGTQSYVNVRVIGYELQYELDNFDYYLLALRFRYCDKYFLATEIPKIKNKPFCKNPNSWCEFGF